MLGDTLDKKIMAFMRTVDPEKGLLYELYHEKLAAIVAGPVEGKQEFLEQATDEEIVNFLGDASLRAPLGSEHYRIFMNLFTRVFKSKIEIPEDLQENRTLDSFHESLLRRLRQQIRQRQHMYLKGHQ